MDETSECAKSDDHERIYEPSLSRRWVFQDYAVNRYRPRIQALLMLFRLCQALRWPFDRRPSLVAGLATLIYRFFGEWLLTIEIPVKTHVGPRLQIVHGYSLVVNVDAILGAGVILRQSTTIGNRGDGGKSPIIGDGADVGSNSVLLGPIVIGRGAKIGAGAVVVADIPPDAIAVGNPARWRIRGATMPSGSDAS